MISPVPDIIEDIRQGRMVILVDDEDRENEGDLVVAAEMITPEMVNFMARHGRGLICMPLTPERIAQLELPPMTTTNQSHYQTAFHVSIGAAQGITTGISASDRAKTVLAAIAPDAKPSDLVRPGHVFPLRAREGGVLVRAGHTEASVDLARMAGLEPAAVICEIMNEDGTMARLPELERFATEHGLKIGTIRALIEHRRATEKLVRRAAETRLPTEFGEFRLVVYENDVDERQHLALVKGEITPDSEPLVRVHSECLTGDVLHSLRCDCGAQLARALEMMEAHGTGVLVYMRQEGRGIGLVNKIKAYALQDQGMDTVEANHKLGFSADAREYGLGAQILHDLGVRKMKLLTNNPVKRAGIEGYGLTVTGREPLIIEPNEHNRRYMETKKQKLGHLLTL